MLLDDDHHGNVTTTNSSIKKKKKVDETALLQTTCIQPTDCYRLIGGSLYVISNNTSSLEEEGSTFYGSKIFGDESKCHSHCDSKPLLGNTSRGLEIVQAASSVSGSEALIDVHTPQYKAACWIIYDDARQVNADDGNILQRYILALLFYTLGGAGWYSGLDFLTPKHECQWNMWLGFDFYLGAGDDGFGVHCNGLGHVSGLGLPSNNLVGTLPFELSSLANIKHIIFDDNFISGSIPSNLGILQHMLSISFDSNALTGSIPESIGDMKSLIDMSFAHNLLTGTLPVPSVIQEDIENLHMTENMLTGALPADVCKSSSLATLQFTGNKLNGTIPECLGDLTSLVHLTWDSNNLVGTLPSKILALPRLETLWVVGNLLTGSIPSNVVADSPLSVLLLGRNQLSGTIPTEYSLLTNLQYLWLQYNLLSGEMPSNFTKLENLEELMFHSNDITGLSPFHDCQQSPPLMEADCDTPQKVSCLCCSACHGIFTSNDDGVICESGELTLLFENLDIGDLVQLDLLQLETRESAGKVVFFDYFSADKTTHRLKSCLSMSGCFNIEVRNFNTKSFEMKLLINDKIVLEESITEYSQRFYFGFNNSDGTIRQDSCDDFMLCNATFQVNSTRRALVDKLTSITGVQVFDDVSSSYYKAACKWVNYLEVHDEEDYKYTELVQYFYLGLFFYETNGNEWSNSNMWITNTSFCSWYGIECDSYNVVTSIKLPSNNLRGTLPTEIGELRGLESLVLGENDLHGGIPIEIGAKLTLLEEFNVTRNRFLGSLPSEVSLLTKLKRIDASHNELSGSLPAEIGAIENVEIFNFFHNTLSGELPESFFSLSTLKEVNLGNNLLAGDASRVKNFFSLEMLDLSENFFTGTIPLSSNQKKLRVLQLSGNQFRGSIPASIEQLGSLAELFVYNNELTGNLPSQLGNLSNLLRMSLSYNRIKGSLASEIGKLSKLTLLHLHNNEIEGNADHFGYSIEDFIADCGNTYTAPARVECLTCSSCCNVEGDCLSKNITWPAQGDVIEESQMEARAFVFLMALAASFALCALLFLLSLFCNTNEIAFPTEFQDESIYRFLLSKNHWAKVLAVLSVLLQLFLLSIFIEASDFTSARNDWEYSMSCPENSIHCEDKRGITPLAWLAFSCVLFANLMKDMLEGSRMVYESIIIRSLKGVFAGFVVMYITIASAVASTLYNYSTGISSTDILKDAAILLFLNYIDEQLYELIRVARPNWVEERNKSVKIWLDRRIRARTTRFGNLSEKEKWYGDEESNRAKEPKNSTENGDSHVGDTEYDNEEMKEWVGVVRVSNKTEEIIVGNDHIQHLENEIIILQRGKLTHEKEIKECMTNFLTLEKDHLKLKNKHTALEKELDDVKKTLKALEARVN